MTQPRKPFESPLTRRSFLQRAGIGGATVMGGTLLPKILRAGTLPSAKPPINHVIIS